VLIREIREYKIGRKDGLAPKARGIDHASIHNRSINSSSCSFLFYAENGKKQQKQIRRLFRLQNG